MSIFSSGGGGGLFGSMPPQNSGGLFGGQVQSSAMGGGQSNGIFGGSGGAIPQGGGGSFGGGGMTGGGGLFGGGGGGMGPSTGGGLFGASAGKDTLTPGTGGPFGTSAPNMAASQPSGGLFGGAPQGGSLFGRSANGNGGGIGGGGLMGGGGMTGATGGGGLFGSGLNGGSAGFMGVAASSIGIGTSATSFGGSSGFMGSTQANSGGLFGGASQAPIGGFGIGGGANGGQSKFENNSEIPGTQMDEYRDEVRDKLKVKSYNCMPKYTSYSTKMLRLKDYQDFKIGKVRQELSKGVETYLMVAKGAAQPSGFGGGSLNSSGFGMSTAANSNSGMFGGSGTTGQPSGGLFGGSAGGAAGGLFGSAPQNAGSMGGQGLFGGSVGGGGQPQASGGLFGSSGGGAQGQSGGLFGGPIGGQQQPQGGGGLFGGQAGQTQAGGLFGGQGGGGLFGGQGGQTQGGGLFGGQGGQTQGGGLFGGQGGGQQQTGSASGGLFGGGMGGGQGNGYQTGATGMFGASGSTPQVQPQASMSPQQGGYMYPPQGYPMPFAGGDSEVYYIPVAKEKIQAGFDLSEFLSKDSSLPTESKKKSLVSADASYLERDELMAGMRQSTPNHSYHSNPLDNWEIHQIAQQNLRNYATHNNIGRRYGNSRSNLSFISDSGNSRSALDFSLNRSTLSSINSSRQVNSRILVDNSSDGEMKIRVQISGGGQIEIAVTEKMIVAEMIRKVMDKVGIDSGKDRDMRYEIFFEGEPLGNMKHIHETKIRSGDRVQFKEVSFGKNKEQEADIGIVPFLSKNGYETSPRYPDICRMKESQLKSVENFTIYNEFAKVKFLDFTDIRRLNLDKIISLDKGSVEIYPSDTEKPPIGQGLNKKALVTLYKIGLRTKGNTSRYLEKFKSKIESIGGEFIGSDIDEDSVTFRIEGESN